MTSDQGIENMTIKTRENRPVGYRDGSHTSRPLVTVHGALSDHRIYGPMTRAFGAHRRIVGYDQAYFGPNAWPDMGQGFSRQRHEEDLIALVEGLESGPVDLFAWSYGGDVAVHTILRRPDLFHAVVLFDPSVGAALRHIPGADATKAQFHDALAPSVQLLSAGEELAAAKAFFAGVTGLRLEDIDGMGGEVAAILADNARTLAPFLKALTAGGGPDIAPAAVARLPMPALILTGERSLLRYRIIADWLASLWPDAERKEVRGATHFGPWENATEVAALADEFLSRAEPGQDAGACVA